MRWHSSPAIYEKECFNFPGFLTVFRKGTDMNNKMNRLDYVNYRHVCHKWHFRLTKSVITCLESKNYSQMRNSLIVLTKILPNFPIILYAGQLMSKKPTWVQETEFHIKEPKKTNNTAAQNQTQQQWQSDSSSGISTKRDVDGRSKDVKPELMTFISQTTASTCSRVKKEARDSPDQYHRQAGTDQTEDSGPKRPRRRN
nr:THO complex subunit 2 [Biomphalaria glabrata]